MKTKKIAKLLEFINNEQRLEKVTDKFYYHGVFFTNQQIINLFKHRKK